MKEAAYLGREAAAKPALPNSRFYLAGPKRLFDIVLALLLMPMIALLVGVLWLLVRLDGGPGFYAQGRVGKDGRRFRCWKLRTMVVDAENALAVACARDPRVAQEWREMQKLHDDPRITRVGAVLRKTSLDELPQIWNVLRGDMSFVGPRPFTLDQERLYVDGGGSAYFRLRPGITGPWQVEGRGTTSFLDRVRYDNDYYALVSFRYDLWLLFRTAVVVLRRTGS